MIDLGKESKRGGLRPQHIPKQLKKFADRAGSRERSVLFFDIAALLEA
jgi:hypothetical protein